MSSDLVWFLTRNYHSKLVKRVGGKSFSGEAGNLASKHTYHNSGYIHPKIVDVRAASSGKGVAITTKDEKAPATQIKKAYKTEDIAAGSRRKTGKAVKNIVDGYRPELSTLAVAKSAGILRSQKPAKQTRAPRVRSAKAKAAAAKETSA